MPPSIPIGSRGENLPLDPAYLIIYQPSGGWDNNQTDDAKLPADFESDYMRAWQPGDLASDVDRNSP